MIFAEFINKICLKKEIKQAQIAKHLGVTPFLVNHWFKGRQLPTVKQLERILEFIKADEDEKARGWDFFRKEKEEIREDSSYPSGGAYTATPQKGEIKEDSSPPIQSSKGVESAIQTMLVRVEAKIENQHQNIMKSIQGLESRMALIEGQHATIMPPQAVPTVRVNRSLSFAEFIFKICSEKKVKQNQIARHLGVTPFLVNHWFKGRQLPTVKQLERILEFIKADEDEKAEAREVLGKERKGRGRPSTPPILVSAGSEDAIQEMLVRIEAKIENQHQNIMESIQGLKPLQDITTIRVERPRKLPGGVVRIGRIRRGGELRIGHTVSTEVSFHPYESLSGMWVNFHQLVFDRLVNVAPEGFSKSLAYDWLALNEYSYVFRIREDVLFHNGKQLTAKDVVYSYQEWQKHHEGNPIHSVEALENCNEHTVKIELKRTLPPQTTPPMPHIIPQGGFPDNKPIGAGSFQVESIQKGLLKLTANRNYFGDKPYLDKVVVEQYENSEKLREALNRREIDFACGLYYPTDDFITVKDVNQDAGYHLIFNMADEEISKNKNLRKAIYYGLDRKAIAKIAGVDNPEFSSGPYSVALEDYSDKDKLYDLDEAMRLLQESTPLERPLLISSSMLKSERRRNLVDAVVAELDRLGIPAKRASETVPLSECQARVEIINCAPKLEREFWHSTGKVNLMKYKNREVDALLDRNVELDESDVHQLRKLILEDCPAVPLFLLSTPVTYDKRLKATEQRLILPRFFGEIPYWYLEEALPEEEERAIAS